MNSKTLRFLVSLALIILVFWLVGPARVGAAFASAAPGWLIAGFICAMIANLCSALRWHALVIWLGMSTPRRVLILAYWRGITANTVLPGATLGGDALRALHLKQAGHGLAAATASVLLDRLSGLWVLAAISLATSAVALGTGLLPAGQLPLSTSIATVLTLVALAAPLMMWQLSATARHHLPARLAGLLDTLHQCPRPLAQYMIQLAWSGIVQAASILAFACGGWAVGLELPFWQFLIAAGPVFIFAALPISIGGWGTREAAAGLMLGLLGAPRDLAVATAVLYGMFAALQGLLGAVTMLKPAHKPRTDR